MICHLLLDLLEVHWASSHVTPTTQTETLLEGAQTAFNVIMEKFPADPERFRDVLTPQLYGQWKEGFYDQSKSKKVHLMNDVRGHAESSCSPRRLFRQKGRFRWSSFTTRR